MNSADVDRIQRQLKSLDLSAEYFAFTLLERDGRRVTSVHSQFVGWPSEHGPGAAEIRKATIVVPEVMTDLWDGLGEPWIVVSTPGHLRLYLHMGGNALVERIVAQTYLPGLVKPRVVIRNGPLGFERFAPDAREVLRRRPRPWQRRRVLARDDFECQLCGARRDDGVDLDLHHILKFSRGGPTTEENLITLCKPCHRDLEPHEDWGLFFLPSGHLDRALRIESPEAHRDAVARYRSTVGPAGRGRQTGS